MHPANTSADVSSAPLGVAASRWDSPTGWKPCVVVINAGRVVAWRPTEHTQGLPPSGGVVTGGFTDHHVHLSLVDHSQLAGGLLAQVHDLGASPERISALAHGSSHAQFLADTHADTHALTAAQTRLQPHFSPRIFFAGSFLTAPGGYPSDRSWAPQGSVREVATRAEIDAAMREMAEAGATWAKIALNTHAGPVFDDETLTQLVASAKHHNLAPIAHAEGQGQAERARLAGINVLAHTPFSERLSDRDVKAQAHGGVMWLTTLAIHDGTPQLNVALDNLSRYVAEGQFPSYGTDMGNGPTPVGLNLREIELIAAAGVTGDAMLAVLGAVDPRQGSAVFVPETGGQLDFARATLIDPHATV